MIGRFNGFNKKEVSKETDMTVKSLSTDYPLLTVCFSLRLYMQIDELKKVKEFCGRKSEKKKIKKIKKIFLLEKKYLSLHFEMLKKQIEFYVQKNEKC